MYDPYSIVYIFSNLKFVEYNDLRVMRALALWYARGNLVISRFLLAKPLLCCYLNRFLHLDCVVSGRKCMHAHILKSEREEETEVQRLIKDLFFSAALCELAANVLTLYHSMRLRLYLHTYCQ